jgi:molecular chaperone DnaK (HSP70)
MAEKDFFITAIPMIELQGSTHIPTVVYYEKSKRALIGYDAKVASEATGRGTLNEDFKIDIGKEDPTPGKFKRRFRTASGDEKSAGEITGDFLDGLLKSVRDSLPTDDVSKQAGVVIVEPITMQGEEVKEDWLGNYRATLRRILLGKGFTKDKIDFMPEPFAVFQYYKYGLKHPLLGPAKQVALVLDFGGGSFVDKVWAELAPLANDLNECLKIDPGVGVLKF